MIVSDFIILKTKTNKSPRKRQLREATAHRAWPAFLSSPGKGIRWNYTELMIFRLCQGSAGTPHSCLCDSFAAPTPEANWEWPGGHSQSCFNLSIPSPAFPRSVYPQPGDRTMQMADKTSWTEKCCLHFIFLSSLREQESRTLERHGSGIKC